MAGIIEAYNRGMENHKKISNIEEKIREDFDNPDLTREKIKTWIKYQLLFYNPNNFATREAANILCYHDNDPGPGKTLVYDELLKLDKKTQNNYRKILEIFEPVFNPGKKPPMPYDNPKQVFQYVMDIFVGKAEHDEKKIEEAFAKYPEDIQGYKGYCNLCKNYLGPNEVNKYMKKKKEKKNIKENENIELFVDRLDKAIGEFWLERRGMDVDVYEIAGTKMSVGY